MTTHKWYTEWARVAELVQQGSIQAALELARSLANDTPKGAKTPREAALLLPYLDGRKVA